VNSYEAARRVDPGAAVDDSLGRAYLKLKKYLLAVESFKSAVSKKKDSSDSWRLLGYSYSVAGKSDLAIAAYKQAIVVDGNNSRAHSGLGLEYYSQSRLDAAEHEFNAVLANRNSGIFWQCEAHYALALCDLEKWHFGSAMVHLKRIGELDPQQTESPEYVKAAKDMLDNIQRQQDAGRSLQQIRALNEV
jgi:tetratricopeptide (TPR) repeat protein